jgi:ABC-type glycerol-3-phosphate transport system substrate-binding protein
MKKIAMLFVVMLTIGTLGFANSKKEEAAKNVSITVQAETGWMSYYQAAIDRVIANNPGATIKIVETAIL